MDDRRQPRKTPKQARSKALVDAVVQATASLATEIGIQAVTIPGIATRAGVSTASVYEYFPTKEAVLAAWAESTWERALQAGFEALERAIVVDKLPVETGMGRVIVAINRELRVFARGSAGAGLVDMVGRSELRRDHMDTISGIIEGILAGASDVTAVRVTTPAVAAKLLASVLVADSYTSFLAAFPPEEDGAVDGEVTDLFRRYLRGDSSG